MVMDYLNNFENEVTRFQEFEKVESIFNCLTYPIIVDIDSTTIELQHGLLTYCQVAL